jgi:hypothetical protein
MATPPGKIPPFRPKTQSSRQEEDALLEQSRRYGELEIARMQMAQQQREQSMPSQQREGMRFGTFLFFLVPSIVADIVDFVTAGTIGWIIGIAVDAILLIGLGFSKNKKRSQVYKILAGLGLETVLPVLGMLPFRTIFVVWAYASEKPKVQKAMGVATKVLQFSGPKRKVEKMSDSDTIEEAA